MNQYAAAILDLLGKKHYTPLNFERLAIELGISKGELPRLRKCLDQLQEDGAITCIKRDRYCLPRDADLVVGTIRFRQSGSAILIPEPPAENNKPQEPYAIAAEDTWVALHGDRVVARVQPFRERFRRGRRFPPDVKDQPAARVIRILERKHTTLTGTLQKSRVSYFVVPDDPRIIQDIIVPDPASSAVVPAPTVNCKVIVRLLEWKQRHLNPEGEIVAVLGATHAPLAEYRALLHRYNLDPEFPDNVMRELVDLPDYVASSDLKGRVDLRELNVFTIDPDDAKDFDDALSIERFDDGRVRIGIHIADVSSYVRPGSALDNEARRRGNSTYLVGTVIPMLPHKLSNGLCSLVENEDRLTKSVFITYAAKGRELETRFANTVIRSRKRLTYRQAYALLTDDDLNKIRAMPLPAAHQTGSTGRALRDLADEELVALQNDIRDLWAIAERLRRNRMRKGSLDLDMPEMKIFVDAEGYADRIERIEYDESHQLIEEFMLCANEAVARELRQINFPLIHRVHDKPDPEKLDELRDFMATVGITVGDLTKRREVVNLLRSIREHPQAYTLRIQFLRSLKQACYRASPDGHYGLNKTNYTHFTSPIRRYSDLIVHRIFARFLEKHAGAVATERFTSIVGNDMRPNEPSVHYSQGELEHMADEVSATEQNSTEAERESIKIKLLEFFERELSKDLKTSFEAVITDIKNHGAFVELTESMAFGLVHISTLRDDLYHLSPDGSQLIGRRTRKTLTLGDRVSVEVARVDRFKRQIDFQIVGFAGRTAGATELREVAERRPRVDQRNKRRSDRGSEHLRKSRKSRQGKSEQREVGSQQQGFKTKRGSKVERKRRQK